MRESDDHIISPSFAPNPSKKDIEVMKNAQEEVWLSALNPCGPNAGKFDGDDEELM